MYETLLAAIETLFLGATLVFVIRYTREAEELKKATLEMLKVQEKGQVIQKRPSVSFFCLDERKFFFQPVITNFGMIHAKARVRATISVQGQPLELDKGGLYGGGKTWQIQASGGSREIRGNFGMENLCKEAGLRIENQDTCEARVTIESWVIYFWENEEGLNSEDNKGPIVQWYRKEGWWVPELSPVAEWPV